MGLRGPRSEADGEDRFVQCEQELEAEFQALVWKAVMAGWDEAEACVAISSLADHHVLAMQSNEAMTAPGAVTGIVLRKP